MGHEITLIATAEATIHPGLDARITVARMRPYAGPVLGRLRAVDARRAIGATLRDVDPDVLHVHDLTTGFGWLARVSGFHPVVLTAWGSDLYRLMPATRASRLIGRLSLGGADLVTVNSHDLWVAAVRQGANDDRMRLVQFGVDTDRFRPGDPDEGLKARLGLAGRKVIFAPRQIARLYDQSAIVQAASELGPDIAVLMSAKAADPGYLAEILETAAANGLGDRLVVVPEIPHDDMADYYRIADVVASVPRSDATAVTILEAMACGRPIVASDLASPREWLTDIWPVVQPGDHAGLTQAIARLFVMPEEERRSLGERARVEVLQRAERSVNMRLMESYYQTLASRRVGARA
jgi:glycosyltransferase involved in cell wall biosynthesis